VLETTQVPTAHWNGVLPEQFALTKGKGQADKDFEQKPSGQR
jgi:hypothetical protein